MSAYLSAADAAARLGVSRATLYAYVSRGLIRSKSEPGRRSRAYSAEDVERWLKQQSGRRNPAGVATQALSMSGLPVLRSALTLIEGGRLYYRGQDAIRLSENERFESVLSLLWGGTVEVAEALALPSAGERTRWLRLHFAAAAQCYLAFAEARDLGAYNLATEAVRKSGARIVRGLCALASGISEPSVSVAQALARAWGLRGPRAAAPLDAALILCADHELNVSAFTARAIASAGATPYMAVSGALAALSGHRHGGHTERVALFLDEAGEPRQLIAERLRRGQAVPGFGHALYPAGDPRAVRLLELCPKNAAKARALGFAEAGRELLGERPSVDFALVALARALGLPKQAPFVLFALGRSAGWVAHALEQYQSEELIRPRAQYVGPLPAAPL